MSLRFDGISGLIITMGAAALVFLLVLVLLVRTRRGRGRPRPDTKKTAAAGWYADPAEDQKLRFWNGEKWTDSPAN